VSTSTSTKRYKPKRKLKQLKLTMKRLTSIYQRPNRYLYDKIKEPISIDEKEDISELTLLSLKKIVDKIKKRKL
jgi:hypothetical protein